MSWLRAGLAVLVASSATLAVALAPVEHAAATPDALTRPAVLAAHPGTVVLLDAAKAGARLVAVGERGIVLLSDDDGKSWRQATMCPTSVTLTAVRFVSPEHGWATGHAGLILATDDGGEHWHEQVDGNAVAQALLKQAQSTQTAVPANQLAEAQRLVTEGADKPFFDVWFADEKRGFAVGAYNLFVHTEDGGATWSPELGLLPNPRDNHLYAVRGRGDLIFIAGEQGLVLRSTNGGRSFEALALPYQGSLFTLALLPAGELIVAGLRGNAFRSTDNGNTWQPLEGLPPVTWIASALSSDGTLWLGNQAGQLFASQDAGLHWTPVPRQPGSPSAPLTGLLGLSNTRVLETTLRGVAQAALPSVAIQ